MLHTPTGVLHKNEAFSDEATPVFISLRRGKPFHFAMKRFSFHSKYEAPQMRYEDIMRDTRGLSRFCLKVKKRFAS